MVHISEMLWVCPPKKLLELISEAAFSPCVLLINIAMALASVPLSGPFSNCFLSLKSNLWWSAFLFLFLWKAIKILVHCFSFYILTNRNLHRQKLQPTFSSTDVTVIVPSVGEFDAEFVECIESILQNSPRQIIVSTVGSHKLRQARKVCLQIEENLPVRRILVTAINQANKRAQFMHGVEKVKTSITAFADDHVFWGPEFLENALAPFEDHKVGLVGTNKRVRRIQSGTFFERLLNYLAVIYLERHNFECSASYNIDGGVFIISGRTALSRTCILQTAQFKHDFINETWWFGKLGPLKVDDDNFICRYMVNNGHKTVFHNSPETLMSTSLGVVGGLEKFSGQIMRWVRTGWRSNSTSLFAERNVWFAHPWTAWAMMWCLFFNVTLLYDTLLILTLYNSGSRTSDWILLFIFLVVAKTIKQASHLWRNPRDIFPFWILGMLFGYVHSLCKIYALFTAKNIGWTGRKGIDAVGRPAIDRSITHGTVPKLNNFSALEPKSAIDAQ